MKQVIITKTNRVDPDLVATVDMTKEDALLFRLFQQHYDNFKPLVEGRVFDVRSGRAVLHFDSSGRIKNIDINLRTL